MRSSLLLLLAVAAAAGAAVAQKPGHGGCHSPAYWGPPNPLPLNDGTKARSLKGTVKNGKLYEVAVPNPGLGSNASTFYREVHVWGTAYEMGYAQGELLTKFGPPGGAKQFIDSTWAYIEGQIGSAISGLDLPQWLDDDIEDLGLTAALDATYLFAVEYAPQHFWDEMKGLADAGDVDYTKLRNVHMIAGLTQGACSMFGVWGDSLDKTAGTGLLQLRALDWDMDGPFRNYPQVTVYHPASPSPGGHAFANIGMSGFIGGLTGVSSTQLGISEIGVSYPDPSFGKESRIGIPFIFILRDILQFDTVLQDAQSRLASARRTCDLILGVGDGKENQFTGFEYSYSVLDIMTDTNMRPYNETWHPRIKNMVYWGMDWDCPSFNKVLATQLKKYDGKITPKLAISDIVGVEQSGDNHAAIYDLQNNRFYVSFAAPHDIGGPKEAYFRQWTDVDAALLFAEKPPATNA